MRRVAMGMILASCACTKATDVQKVVTLGEVHALTYSDRIGFWFSLLDANAKPVAAEGSGRWSLWEGDRELCGYDLSFKPGDFSNDILGERSSDPSRLWVYDYGGIPMRECGGEGSPPRDVRFDLEVKVGAQHWNASDVVNY